ncbi:hypothetical protein EAE91_16685 [Photorhabdus noenieputensis]|uniref:hypothetical protein n=1 Tax=Photorhabdus noenieputensis TaxID=1208607 RepID=UPI001BD44107|nr:hypothetical protein [Photorhabdus noenieputensis]MBS9438720.1 hypothetical protein [Photorhabdus noenieputensis]MCK3668086.1 hypothetical protein [Photorhabdus noenieputensis]
MFNISYPFESKKEQRFHWLMEQLAQTIFSTSNQIVVRNGFAVVSEEQWKNSELRFLDEKQYSWKEINTVTVLPVCNSMKRQRLLLCKLEAKDDDIAPQEIAKKYVNYQCEMIRMQLIWIKRWISILLDHTAQRKVGNVSLLSISSIRLRLAQVIQRQLLLFQCVGDIKEEIPSQFAEHAAEEIEEMVNILIKTTGGRALLQQGLVEMQHIFSVLNQVYLREFHG